MDCIEFKNASFRYPNGSRPFSKANAALEAMGEQPIDWQLPEHVDESEM